jgi:hypothetical protein
MAVLMHRFTTWPESSHLTPGQTEIFFEHLEDLQVFSVDFLTVFLFRQADLVAMVNHGRLAQQSIALLSKAGTRDDALDSFQQVERHGYMGTAILPYLVKCQVENPAERGWCVDDPDPIVLILATGCGEGTLGEITKCQDQVVDAGHGREWVVDARRQGATGNLDQLVDEQFKVLILGSLSPGDEMSIDLFTEIFVACSFGWEDFHQGGIGHQEVPDAM